MKAILLVGGEGTRLRPLTYRVPKQMLPIVERPMIERVLEHLGSHGVDEAVLSLQYLPDAFTRAYPDTVAAGVKLSYAIEPTALDTAGAIRFAAEHAQIDDTFIVMNGDVLTDLDLGALVAFHRSHGAEGTLRLYPVEDPSRFGVVSTDPDGKVLAFVEKPSAQDAPSNLINAGTYVFEPAFLKRVPLGQRVSIERVTFPAMALQGQLFAMAEPSYWLDTGTPASFLRANLDLIEGRRNTPPCPGAFRHPDGTWRLGPAIVEGQLNSSCFLGEEVVVEAGATGECTVLGPSSVLSTGSSVRSSVIMAGVRVGPGALVERAIVGAGAQLGAKCVVRAGSVIDFDAVVPAGSVVDGGWRARS